jgi:hypothetical protein
VDISQPLLLDETEAAALIGLPVRRLRKHRMAGLGPEFVKVGSSVYYKRDSLIRYLASLPTGGNGVPTAALKRTRQSRIAGASMRTA